jgi:ABC-type nitrate/sulfonate/bicarbonate transport system ATPase subunit
VNVGITLDQVSKRFPGPGGGTLAVEELSMQVPAGQLVALVGPSGCGKTTTLKMINRGEYVLRSDLLARSKSTALVSLPLSCHLSAAAC